MKRLFVALCCMAAFPIVAAVLFDNGGPNPEAGAVASNFAGHDPEYEFQSADDFTLSSDSMITAVRWWGIYQGSNIPLESDSFTLRIFADAGGQPASDPLLTIPVQHIRRARTGITSSGYDVYEYNASIAPPIKLAAGTYWISTINDVEPEEVGVDWLWVLNSATSGNFVARVNDGAPWEPLHSFSLAFEIRGTAR
jgi:hypothetical protein